MNQAQAIKDFLENHPEGITALEALEKFGCFRLGARIYDLKRQRMNIETVNETGNKKTYARYFLKRTLPGKSYGSDDLRAALNKKLPRHAVVEKKKVIPRRPRVLPGQERMF